MVHVVVLDQYAQRDFLPTDRDEASKLSPCSDVGPEGQAGQGFLVAFGRGKRG